MINVDVYGSQVIKSDLMVHLLDEAKAELTALMATPSLFSSEFVQRCFYCGSLLHTDKCSQCGAPR